MLLVISPAKSLDFETPSVISSYTQPKLLSQSLLLIKELRKLSPVKLAKLMNISPKLAELNTERNFRWDTPFSPQNAKQAILAFRGDVYTGLGVDDFTAQEFTLLQQRLRILSGLYGLLCPLDLIQAYRLEMGTKLANPKGKNLYEFWGNRITKEINTAMKENNAEVLVNLASQEYFKAVKVKELKKEIVTPIFKESKGENYKVISFYAKKARGLMTRFIIKNNIKNSKDLKAFNTDKYTYSKEQSDEKNYVFLR